MRNKLYQSKPSYNHLYFYSITFVGIERPIIYSDNEYEYYVIRDQFIEWCNDGRLESFGIEKLTKPLVRRIDVMKSTKKGTIQATIHLKSLCKTHGALNDPNRPTEPANLLDFLCKREEQLADEARELEMEMLTQNISIPDNKEEYIMRVLEQKYDYIYKDIDKQWKSRTKRVKKPKLEVLDAVA